MRKLSLVSLTLFIGIQCTPWPSATMVLNLQGEKKEDNPILLLLTASQSQKPSSSNQSGNPETSNSNPSQSNTAGSPPEIGPYNNPNSQIYVSTAIQPITPSFVTGNPTQCNISPPLPSGLTIDPTTCVISGTPTQTSPSTTYTITPINEFGSGNPQTITFDVITGFAFLTPKYLDGQKPKKSQITQNLITGMFYLRIIPFDNTTSHVPDPIYKSKHNSKGIYTKNHG